MAVAIDKNSFPDRAAQRVEMRSLNGADELSLRALDTAEAIDLLGRVCQWHPAGSAGELSAGARERLLARLYQNEFGPNVDSSARCSSCGKMFDVRFGLDELVRSMSGGTVDVEQFQDGTFRTRDGIRFRLPTGNDELAAAELSPADAETELLRRSLLDNPAGVDSQAVQEAMEKVSPIIDLDLDTVCPECGAGQKIHFDLQTYVLKTISQGRRRVMQEVHLLASAYHWGLAEILQLPIRQRQNLVDFIDRDNDRRGGI